MYTNVSKSVTAIEKIHSHADNFLPFFQVAMDYTNIDPGFAYATWALETGNGTSELWINRNNPAGIIKLDGSGEYQTYASQEDGLRAMFDLIEHYCKKGINTVQGIRSIWAESESAEQIVSIWKEIMKGK